jgi:hypothetical protein
MTVNKMLMLFSSLKSYLASIGVKKVVYKAVPSIYHRIPSDEDLYAIIRSGGHLIRRDVGSAIAMAYLQHLAPTRIRQRMARKAASSGIVVKQSFDYTSFMALEEKVLMERHNTKPVHTAAEMKYLSDIFPDRIKLYIAETKEGLLRAGSVIFEHDLVAHVQYNANTDVGRHEGAADAIYFHLINEVYRDKKFFDFGISTEDGGKYLNDGLIAFKEGFGARAVVHDFYEINI